MILTVLVGNSSTRCAWFAGRHLIRSAVVATRLLPRRLPSAGRVAAASLASVVPALTRPVCRKLAAATGRPVLIVDSHTRTGLRFKYGRGQLGADRLCDAVGAVGRFGGNLIVLDFGTAFTVNVISEEGVFLGGAILPGFGLMADSLAWGTAALPHVTFRHVLNPIQHGTKSAIRAGISSLAAGGVDGIIGQIEEQTGMSFLVVATGGYASLMRRCVGRIRVVDPHLASRGLAELLYMNTPAPRAGD